MRDFRKTSARVHADPARFVVRMAEVLHAHGTPAHRLEAALARLARAVGVQAHVFSNPTSLLFAFDDGEHQQTVLRRVEPGVVDLGKLVELDEVLDALGDERIDLATAWTRAEAIAAAPPRYGTIQVAVAHAFASAGAATLFGGSLVEVGAALLVGWVLGLLAHALARLPHAGLFEPAAAFVATVLAAVLARGIVPVRDHVVVLAGIIILIPGLSFTVAMVELTTRHLMSGVARLAGAATVFLTLGFGVAIGRGLVDLAFPPVPTVETLALHPWVTFAALPLSAWALSVLLKARRRELGWILVTTVLGFSSSQLGQLGLGPTMGSFCGAFVIGSISNVFARLRDRPASVPLTPALLVLVPGSVGYRALDLFLARDPIAGMQTGFEMVIAATSLVAGLLCANVVVPPRRSL